MIIHLFLKLLKNKIMRKKILLIFSLLGIVSFSLSAQVLTLVDQTITKDTLVATIQRNIILDSKTIVASGEANFFTNSGYVRVLLSDDYDYDLLVYESFPLVAVEGKDIFNHAAIETYEIPSNLTLTKVRVEIMNAVLNNLLIEIVPSDDVSVQQEQARKDRITLINSNLNSQNALWIAGETSISQMSYEEKKKMFEGSVPDLQGFEYYIGGIFDVNSDTTTSIQRVNSSYVSSFDWRNRHGANNQSSPYYNSEGHGWITSVKNQIPLGACWMFAGTGVTEALSNLYFNQHINLDLSEQDAISCCGSCWGSPARALEYIKTTGVVQETCFPYTASRTTPCSDKVCDINLTKITNIAGYDH
jgi:hypothetical protein